MYLLIEKSEKLADKNNIGQGFDLDGVVSGEVEKCVL